MKRILCFVLLLLMGLTLWAQSTLYKQFASRPHVQAYYVERYPIGGDDSVGVTLFASDDSMAFRQLRRELMELPFHSAVPRTGHDESRSLPEGVARAKADSLARTLSQRKHLVTRMADALIGDDGVYEIYFPSDRMVALVFHCRTREEERAVLAHMIRTELH